MWRFIATMAVGLSLLLLTGCGATSDRTVVPPRPSQAPADLVQATPEQFVRFMPVIHRYFHYRKKAVIAGEVGPLWQEFPALRQGMVRETGMNAETDAVARYRSMEVIDGNVAPEHYARFMVQEEGDKAILLVNGLEMYIRKNFEESGGQLQILLYLERQNGSWTVVRTDETTLAEYHQSLR